MAGRGVSACQKMPLPEVISYVLLTAIRSMADSFRVANYIKPHFEIGLALDKKEFRTGEAVSGKLQLLYPDP